MMFIVIVICMIFDVFQMDGGGADMFADDWQISNDSTVSFYVGSYQFHIID